MVGRGVESGVSARRCQCGHYPTTHVRVVPAPGSPGSFALDPNGPCQACPEGACRRYTPANAAPLKGEEQFGR